VSLLLDENLSPRLIQRLSPLFPSMIHVRDIGLKQASDRVIWEWASRTGYTIVTTDADFAGLSRRWGWPPKVIHLEECDFPLRIIEEPSNPPSLRAARAHTSARLNASCQFSDREIRCY
jgi:predicted nuclease of predicted toxin-antitoxin system